MHPYLLLRKRQMRAKQNLMPNNTERPFRVLLALDGSRMTLETMDLAFERCQAMTRCIDILVVKLSSEPAALLRDFLNQLEQHDIEYRLTITEDSLASQVARHMKRFPGIKTVVTDSQINWPDGLGPVMERLLVDGYRFVFLSKSQNHVHYY